MKLKAFGERVTALDVERLPPDSGPTHFVRVCGALIRWALVEHGIASADLRISERLNVPDRGVDAEYALPDSTAETGGFVGPGRTIFQFKYRDVGDRKAIVSSLEARLRKEVRNPPAGCDRYMLMTNVNLAGTQHSRLRKAILAGAPELATKPIFVWGAAEIANALNASSGLRHLFTAAGGISTVDIAEAELQAAYRRVGWVPLVNRVRELAALREFIESDTARVLRVQGPQYSGRTRLVIKAVKQSAPLALWAVAAEDIDIDLLRDLDSDRNRPLLVVDDDRDEEATRRVLDWAQERQHLKTIVITRGEPRPLDESDPIALNVSRMGTADIETLLQALRPGLPFGERSWIIDGSDGLPGLVAHATTLISEPRLRGEIDPDEFRRRLGHLLTEGYEVRLSAGEREALQIASVLPVIGVEESVASEVAAVAKALDLDRGAFAAHRLALERAGLLRRRGRFVEVVPPLLAEHLASQALANPQRVIAELEVVLPTGRFLHLLDRVARMPGDGIRRAVEQILRERCADFDGLVHHSEVIRRLAPAASSTAIRCIEEGLSSGNTETLATTVTGVPRRALVETLEDLAYRSETFASAARQLLVLAEAENEEWVNNATGVFLSLFHWGHPELSASLSQRLAVLKQGAVSDTPGRRKVVADAAGAAVKQHHVFRLRHPRGPHLPESRYWPKTSEEIDRYGLGIVDLLDLLRRDADRQVRASATKSTIQVFRPLIQAALSMTRPSEHIVPLLIVRAFATLGEVAQTAEDAQMYEQIVTELEILQDSLEGSAMGQPDLSAELQRMASAMDVDLMRSFRGRLWRMLGPPSWKQDARWQEGSEERRDAIRGLASEILEDPDYPSLFMSHLDWLLGSEARSGSELFHVLGERDTRRGLRASLMTTQLTSTGEERLSAYLAGWAQHDREEAYAEVDRLIASRPDLTRALLGTVARLFSGQDLVDRVCRLFIGGGLAPHEFATVVAWLLPWEQLPVSEVERLVIAIDDATPRTRGALLLAFAVRPMRATELSPRLRELAWAFLETSSGLDEAHARLWWDQLAAQLGEAEPRRLLALIEHVAHDAARDRSGGAAGHRGLPLAFAALRKRDRRGLIQMLLRLASHPEATWRIDAAVEDELDPLIDRDALLEFAREAGVEGARTVALSLSAEKPGFWEVARDLLEKWGDDDRVRERLLSVLPGDGWWGSALPMIKERLDKATALRSDPNPWVARWAEEAVSFFELWRRREARDEQEDWIWDYRIQRAQLEGMVRGPDSPDKLWAIGRLLEHAPRERVIELLTPEQILDALEKLPQLPEHVRDSWEPWAKHWIDRH